MAHRRIIETGEEHSATPAESSQGGELHDREKLLRYVTDGLPTEERGPMEEHLRECASCFTHAAKARGLRVSLGELGEEDFTTKGSCPDSSSEVASLLEGELREASARKLREHVLSCPHCSEDVYSHLTRPKLDEEQMEHTVEAH